MKNFRKVLALILVVATLFSFVAMASAKNAAEYADYADVKNVKAVDIISALGITEGYDGKFHPADTIDRDEVAAMIARLRNGGKFDATYYVGADNVFADVKGQWSEGYVTYCAQLGIINGLNATTFNPDGKITVVEAAKLLLCVLGYDAQLQGYVGSNWKVAVIRDAEKMGLLAGIPATDAYKEATRDQVALMFFNALGADLVYGYISENIVSYTNSLLKNSNWDVSVPDIADPKTEVAYNNALISDVTLGNVLGVTSAPTYDCYKRPGTTWYINGTAVKFYKDAPVASYTDGTNPKPANKAVVDVYVNGQKCTADYTTLLGKGVLAEAYAVDGGVRIVLVDTFMTQVLTTSARYASATLANGRTIKNLYGLAAGDVIAFHLCDGTCGAKVDAVKVLKDWHYGDFMHDLTVVTAEDIYVAEAHRVTKTPANSYIQNKEGEKFFYSKNINHELASNLYTNQVDPYMTHVAAGNTVRVYRDAYGYIQYWTAVPSAPGADPKVGILQGNTNKAVMNDTYVDTDELITYTYTADVLDMNGVDVSNISITKDTYDFMVKDETNEDKADGVKDITEDRLVVYDAKGNIVKYSTYAGVDTVLNEVTGELEGEKWAKNGENYHFNANTQYLVRIYDFATGESKYEAVSGYKAIAPYIGNVTMGNMEKKNVVQYLDTNDDGIIDYLFIDAFYKNVSAEYVFITGIEENVGVDYLKSHFAAFDLYGAWINGEKAYVAYYDIYGGGELDPNTLYQTSAQALTATYNGAPIYVALTKAAMVNLSLAYKFDGLTIENGQIALTKDGKVVTRLHAEYNDDVTVYVIANGDDVVTATYTGSEFVTKYQTGEYPLDAATSVYALEYPGTIKTLVLKLAVKDPAKVPAV